MNLKVKETLVIISFFLMIFAAALWSYEQKSQYQGVKQLKSKQDTLLMSFADSLAFVDQQGAAKQVILADLAIMHLVGDIDWFSDGEILLRAQNTPITISDNIISLLFNKPLGHYLTNTLQRCNLETMRCRVALGGKTYPTPYFSYIDPNDDIFISDTRNNQVSWFSEQGVLQAETTGGLIQPLRVAESNEYIVLPNAGGQSLKKLPLDKRAFAATILWKTIAMNMTNAVERDHLWPTSVLIIDEYYWVLSHNQQADASSLFMLTQKGVMSSDLSLPTDATIDMIAQHNGYVIAASHSANKLWHYSLDGDYLGEYSPYGAQAVLAKRQSKYNQYKWYFVVSCLAGGIIFLILLLWALKMEITGAYERRAEMAFHARLPMPDLSKPTLHDPKVEWLAKNKLFCRACKVLPWLLLLFVSGIAAAGYQLANDVVDGQVRYLLIGMLLLLLGLLYLINHFAMRAFKTRIGVKGDWLIVEDHDGIVTAKRARHCFYSGNSLMVGDLLVPLGNKINRVYKKEAMEKLKPVLNHAKQVSGFFLLTLRWRAGDPILLFGIPLTLALLGLSWYLDNMV